MGFSLTADENIPTTDRVEQIAEAGEIFELLSRIRALNRHWSLSERLKS